MVTRFENGIHRKEDGFLGRRDQDVVCSHRLVESGDLGAQFRQTLRLGVAEAEGLPPGPQIRVGAGHQVGHGQALAVRGREQVPGAELVPREEPL